jgi:hypothetical protein
MAAEWAQHRCLYRLYLLPLHYLRRKQERRILNQNFGNELNSIWNELPQEEPDDVAAERSMSIGIEMLFSYKLTRQTTKVKKPIARKLSVANLRNKVRKLRMTNTIQNGVFESSALLNHCIKSACSHTAY